MTPPIEAASSISAIGPKTIKHTLPPVCNHETPTMTWQLPIMNDTARTVTFDSVRHSCSCQSSEIDNKPIPPGTSTMLTMSTDLRHRTGPQRFLSFLKETGGSEWICEVETTVFPRTQFEPVSPLNFGILEAGSTAERPVTFCVYSRTEAELPTAVTFALSGDQAKIVERRPCETAAAADGVLVRKFPIRVQLQAPTAAGPGALTLTSSFVHDGKPVESRQSGGWQLRPTFVIGPPHAFWAALPNAGSPDAMKTLTVRRGDGRPFTIDRIEGGDADVQGVVDKSAVMSLHKTLTVTIRPDGLKVPVWRELTVHSTTHGEASFKVLIAVAASPTAAKPK